MNNLLYQLRGRGAQVAISATGGINLTEAPNELIPLVREQKVQILSALRLERFGGISYENSKLRYDIERFAWTVCRYKVRGIAVRECEELLEILWRIEERGLGSIQDGEKALAESRQQAWDLVAKVEAENRAQLTGERLLGAVKQVLMQGVPAAPKGNRSALV